MVRATKCSNSQRLLVMAGKDEKRVMIVKAKGPSGPATIHSDDPKHALGLVQYLRTIGYTAWIEDKKASARSLLEGYRKILADGGFRDEDVETHAAMKACTSIGECILHEQQRLDCATVVIGRRGISKKEEFIFGSTSNKILHAAKDCAVWVIE